MLQNTTKTLGFKKIMVYKTPPGGGGGGGGGREGKPYLARGLTAESAVCVYVFVSACMPEVYIPFISNTRDMSGNQNFINGRVEVKNGAGVFTGNNRLIIPRFTNLEHTATLVIKIKFTSAATSSSAQRALVSNSDCGTQPSILITEDNQNVYFSVGTSQNPLFNTSVPRQVRYSSRT